MFFLLLACSDSPPSVSTKAPPPATKPVRFLAIGDVGKIDATQKAVASAMGPICAANGCDFALLLGDNLYDEGMESDDDPRMKAAFTDMYGHLGLTFYTVLGNHDYGFGNPERAERMVRYSKRDPMFHLPSTYYQHSVADVDLFGLDTDAVFFNGPGAQGDWLTNVLDASTARWKVVFGHHPYRSNGKHGNAGWYEGWSYIPYLSGNGLHDLFENTVVGRADTYISGHEHNLQVMSHKRLPLLVSGAGSSTRELVDRGNHLELGFATPGFAWVELHESMTVRLYDENGTLLGQTVYAHPRE